MKKATVVAFLLVAWLSALVGCSDSKEKVRRLSMQEKARQDSILSRWVSCLPWIVCLSLWHMMKNFSTPWELLCI